MAYREGTRPRPPKGSMDVGSGYPPQNHFFVSAGGAPYSTDRREVAPLVWAATEWGQGFGGFSLCVGIRLVGLSWTQRATWPLNGTALRSPKHIGSL